MYIKAAVLIKKDEKYLLVQEKKTYQSRNWNWPQGKVENNETPEEAAIREGKEETGLDVDIERKLAVLADTFPDTKELHVFLARYVGGSINFPPDEICDAKWLSLHEVEDMQNVLVGDWVFETIKSI